MNRIKKLASYPPAPFSEGSGSAPADWVTCLKTWTVHEIQQPWNQVHSRTKKYSHESSHIKVSELGVCINLFSPRKAFFPMFDYSLRIVEYSSMLLIIDYCPRRDFAQQAKSRGGTLVTRAYIKESTYSWIYSHTVNIEEISICLNRGCEESVGNDDVSIVCARRYEMVRMT